MRPNLFVPVGVAVLAALNSGPIASAATTTFRVQVPANTPPGDLVYIAGSFQGWNPGHPAYALAAQPDGSWEITLTLPDGVPIQYKFTRGSWATVEKGPNGEEIPNRTHVPQGNQTLNLVVANWADGEAHTITGHVESFAFAPFLAGRRCWVYLPPGYFESSDRYPVLYMHDGQNIFDRATSFAGEWRVDEACETLIGNGEIEPIIVIGIENSPARCEEYTPWPNTNPGIPCRGGGADAYLQAIRDILIQEVNLRYRTQTGHGNTYMAGSSLGGLVSVYAGFEHDEVWGRIAGVSPSYFWSNHEIFNFAAARPRPAFLSHFYQDMGTIERGFFSDQNMNGIDDFIDDLRTMRDIALAQGFAEGDDFLSVEGQGHTHNEFYWALRMPDILRFLIDAPCRGDVNRDRRVDLTDLANLLSRFGTQSGAGLADGDVDGDRDVDLSDLTLVLAAFGSICP